MATTNATAQRVTWDDFATNHFRWDQGEHVAIMAPTGRGKTYLARQVLSLRDWVVVLCSKKTDKTYYQFLQEGYERATKWPPKLPPKGQDWQRVLLWPKANTIAELDAAAPMFHKALDETFTDGNWCVCLDDLYYLCRRLKLQGQIEAIQFQVRSAGVSLVTCMQRPVWVPKACWDQSSHAFIRGLSNVDDLNLIRGLSQVSTRILEEQLRQLRPYEWLYLPVANADSQPPVILTPYQS